MNNNPTLIRVYMKDEQAQNLSFVIFDGLIVHSDYEHLASWIPKRKQSVWTHAHLRLHLVQFGHI